jgi:Cu+-exporting ATPase
MDIQAKEVNHIEPKVAASNACFHCGEACETDRVILQDKVFCCEGCKTVYEILNNNDLCRYYDLDENAGVSLKGRTTLEYAFLDDPSVKERLLDFTDGTTSKISFYLPQIHCASCIWLLENLYKLNDGITQSRVNFLKKEIFITYLEDSSSLRKIVELLASIGYAPSINLGDLDQGKKPVIERKFFYKMGVAGFAFGNIMLLSFPEYLGLDKSIDGDFFQLFGYLNILLALPLIFYSGSDYLRSAWQGLKQKTLNIDVPISLGILTLFGRSVFEILTHTGAGYLDSLAGLVFFLLIGKWFQQRTYHHISFERDYKSYFPIAALLKTDQGTQSVSLDRLNPGDSIIVKHQELIPADAVLLKGEAEIDYSFVTGESAPIACKTGDKVFAGGRQVGSSPIELSLTKKVSQSYLTELWNDEAFTKRMDSDTVKLADQVGKAFTAVILLIAFSTLFYWLARDTGIAINAFTAVLIIACPCAVALAIPFIFGNAIRILGRHGFFLKNTSIIERLAQIKDTIFDKTGTITIREGGQINFEGAPLNWAERQAILQLTERSGHPASRRIHQYILSMAESQEATDSDKDLPTVKEWKEVIGKGVQGIVFQKFIKLGSASFMDNFLQDDCPEKGCVYLQINDQIRGFFRMDNLFREGTWEVLEYFKNRGEIHLLSGDNDNTKNLLTPIFEDGQLRYRQSPKDKLQFVKQLQAEGKEVMMLGDGLNDAGALQQSDAGLVVSENTNNFTPACDAILEAGRFSSLPTFMEFSRRSIRLVYWAYGFALIYNIIGLSFAVQGALSPIVAAILMPLSSISIVTFGMISSNLTAKKMGL